MQTEEVAVRLVARRLLIVCMALTSLVALVGCGGIMSIALFTARSHFLCSNISIKM